MTQKRECRENVSRASARMGQPAVEIEGKKQAVRLDESGYVDRLAVTVIEIDRGEIDPLGGHGMTDAACEGGNFKGDAASSFGWNASCRIACMV